MLESTDSVGGAPFAAGGAMSDLDDCNVTFEQAKEELENVEYKLGQALNIRRDIRRTLIELNRRGELRETALVRD